MRIESPETIASAILSAPGWARVGITAPREALREEAALELARAIIAGPHRPSEGEEGNQLSLSL